MSEKLYEIDEYNKVWVYSRITNVWGETTALKGRHYEYVESERTKSGREWIRQPDVTLYRYFYQEWVIYFSYHNPEEDITKEFEVRIRFWSRTTDEENAIEHAKEAMYDKGININDKWEIEAKKGFRKLKTTYSTEIPDYQDEYIIWNTAKGDRFYPSWDSSTFYSEYDDMKEEWDERE